MAGYFGDHQRTGWRLVVAMLCLLHSTHAGQSVHAFRSYLGPYGLGATTLLLSHPTSANPHVTAARMPSTC